MDGDFQSQYLAAEKAYGAGDFEAAGAITLELLSQLEPVPEKDAEREAVLAWRAFVALLAGHIHLYGFNKPGEARHYYELVLVSNPQDTLQELAEHGLEQTRRQLAPDQPTKPGRESEPTTDSLTLISDPFCSDASSLMPANQAIVTTTAMPWLTDRPSDNDANQQLSDRSKTESGLAKPPEPREEPSRRTATEAVSIETELKAKPQIESDSKLRASILKRLEEGRLSVKLPETPHSPAKTNSESNQPSRRWSWMRKT